MKITVKDQKIESLQSNIRLKRAIGGALFFAVLIGPQLIVEWLK